MLKDSKPSKARHRLLRREALELALYSFRYLPDVTMVVTLLPPAPAKAERIGAARRQKAASPRRTRPSRAVSAQALFYRPGDLEPQLAGPAALHDGARGRRRSTGSPARRRSRIDSLTMSNLFECERAQGQDGRAYLVLERPS